MVKIMFIIIYIYFIIVFFFINARFYMAYVILFLYGIGQLLPWNMFITAHEVARYSRYITDEHIAFSLIYHCTCTLIIINLVCVCVLPLDP